MEIMNSNVTVVEVYQRELSNNNAKMAEMLSMLFPDLDVPMDVLYETMAYLSETKVNAQVIPRVIRGVHNIMIGTGQGQVIVHVKGETMNVSNRETDKQLKTTR